MLVRPATVDRWHRDGFFRRWRRRVRRPGRPRIDSQCRGLIRRLAEENRLWGAPRIHGELLKLGIAVSERTVSRYLRERLRAPSQTWGTFVANHLGRFIFISPATSPYALGADDVVEVSGLTFRQSPTSQDGFVRLSSIRGRRLACSAQRTSPGKHIAQDHVHDRIAIRNSSGRGPPTHGRFGRPTVHAQRVDWSSTGALGRSTVSTIGRARRLAIVVNVVGRRNIFGRWVHPQWVIHTAPEYWRGTPRFCTKRNPESLSYPSHGSHVRKSYATKRTSP